MNDLGWGLMGVIAVAVFAGAFVQAVAGLGVGLVTSPLIAAAAPSLMPSLPLWFGLLVSASALAAEWRHVDWRAISWALPARVVGTPVGVWLVVIVTKTELGIAVAVMVLVAVVLSVRAASVPVNRATLVAAGFTAGVAGTATSIAGPPIALLFQHRPPHEARATMSVFFCLGVIASLVGLAVGGELASASIGAALVALPFLLAGFWAGARARARVDQVVFRRVVLTLCAASAVVLLARALVA